MGGRRQGKVLRPMNDREVKIEVAGDHLIVIQPSLLTDRRARMMFGSVLGATPANRRLALPPTSRHDGGLGG